MMRGLVIREPWAGLILDGHKTWEMRSHGTAVTGMIAIIPKGSRVVAGVVDLVGTRAALSADELAGTVARHGIPPEAQDEAVAGGWLVPWELARPRRLAAPVPYDHPSGAVIWVRLMPEVEAAVRAQLDLDATILPPARTAPVAKAAAPASAPGAVTITLTEANMRWGHVYLRPARHLFSDDNVGGSSKAEPAVTPFRVELGGEPPLVTEIDGKKMILRERGAVRRFLEGALAGDEVRVERLGENHFRFTRLP